jgi:hypothetical protein
MKAISGICRYALVFFCALVTGSVYGIQKMEASPLSPQVSPGYSDHYERAVLSELLPVLNSAGKSGRIYYQATCPPDEHFPLTFPQTDVRPPSRNENALAAVRSMFRAEKRATVTEDKAGIIRVKIGAIADTILQTRIAALHFDQESQYNYLLAIGAIIKTPEVQLIMGELKVRVPARPYNIQVAQPAEGLPHLPSVITNTTMDQALDTIARTWGGVVLYGACTRPDTFEMFFADGSAYFNNTAF